MSTVKTVESGAPLLEEQSLIYIGKKLDFVWKEAGISLHFPAATCKTCIKISVTVAIVTGIDEQSILPQQYRLMPEVSATYRITASAKLPAPVSLVIQHCAVSPRKDSLKLMVAHQGPPYSFKPLPGANFPLESSYCLLEVAHFSLFSILCDWLCGFTLSIQVFYHVDSKATFVVTKDLEPHITDVRNKTAHTEIDDVPMTCDKTTKEIILSVPYISSMGWHITSTFVPAIITISEVHAYEPGRTIPKIKLSMEWKGDGEPKEETVSIPIKGGPLTSFNLVCKPKVQQKPVHSQHIPVPETLEKVISPVPVNKADPPTMQQLLRFHTKSKGIINIIDEITISRIHDLGIFLLNDTTGSKTINIEAMYKHDQPRRTTNAILEEWLQGTGRTPQSWATLITVLKEVENNALAEKISESFST